MSGTADFLFLSLYLSIYIHKLSESVDYVGMALIYAILKQKPYNFTINTPHEGLRQATS